MDNKNGCWSDEYAIGGCCRFRIPRLINLATTTKSQDTDNDADDATDDDDDDNEDAENKNLNNLKLFAEKERSIKNTFSCFKKQTRQNRAKFKYDRRQKWGKYNKIDKTNMPDYLQPNLVI